jgi:hypothetical protein
MPLVAEGFGSLLGKCCLVSSSCKISRSWATIVIEQLQLAANTTDPLLLPFKADFADMLKGVQAGQLDDLPLSISNGDMSSTNLMVTEQGVVSG